MRRNFCFLLLIVYCSLFIAPQVVHGYELLPAGQVINSDYFQSGQAVQIDGDINGDVFLAGGIIVVNGKINGDLFVLGGKININGAVENNVRVAGGDVTLNGSVGHNVFLACGSCNVTGQATIAGSLLVSAGNAQISPNKIGRGFRFLGNRLFLNSAINNEAFVVANREFLLGSQASISSVLKYTGNTEVVLEPGATVAGNIVFQKNNPRENFPRFFGARTILQSYQKIKPLTEFLGFAVSALIGFIFLGLFPKGFEKVANAIENKPVASLGWGVIIALGLPVVTVLFALTIVGIPVSLVLILLAYLIWIASQYLTAFFLGRKIMLQRFGERRGWALFLGLFLIYLLGLIPVLGNLIKLFLVLLTLGAITLAYKQPIIIEPNLIPARQKFPAKRRG